MCCREPSVTATHATEPPLGEQENSFHRRLLLGHSREGQLHVDSRLGARLHERNRVLLRRGREAEVSAVSGRETAHHLC